MKVAFATLGCRVNQYETEAMTEIFIREGYEVTTFDDFSDVYVINTCTVTSMGDKKSRQMISRARRKNPESVIAVVGCYSQTSPDEVSQIEGVNIVLGTRNKSEVLYWVNRSRDEQKNYTIVNDVLKNKMFERLSVENYLDKSRAFIKIQDGCNRFCSYCMIPYARGGVCSKPKEDIIEEVSTLAKNGFKEILFSGIHIASYGIDIKEKTTLMDVLEEVNKIEGIERIRIGSIDPTFFSDDTIDRMVNVNKLCRHFHLSLQSGCDETLQRMNRRYSAKQYKDIVDALRLKMPDVSLSTDVIAGFAGETDEEFNTTYEYLRDLKLTKTHIFKYSPRKGTKAYDMKDTVSPQVKDARSAKLIELGNENERAYIEKFIGEVRPVLFEEAIDEENNFVGYSDNYIKVIAKVEGINPIGEIIKCKLVQNNGDSAKGEIFS